MAYNCIMSGINLNTGINFSADVSSWVTKAKNNADLALQATAQDALETVKSKTPVKTGFLRANWTVLAPNDTMPIAGQEENSSETISKLRFGDNVIIVNPVVYAARIEYGFVGVDSLGRQYHEHPVGMMAQTIAELPDIAKRATERIMNENQ